MFIRNWATIEISRATVNCVRTFSEIIVTISILFTLTHVLKCICKYFDEVHSTK